MLASSALDQTLGRPISPARHRSFLEVDTQLEQLAVNAWCSSGQILSDHAEDQVVALHC